jgi:hypothetical protein
MLGATVTRPDGTATDEQFGVQVIADIASFMAPVDIPAGSTLEFDEVQLNAALFFAANVDAA